MESTVKAGSKETDYILIMDNRINLLRKETWKIIFKEKGNLSWCDIAMTLGMVQYELVHHIDEK